MNHVASYGLRRGGEHAASENLSTGDGPGWTDGRDRIRSPARLHGFILRRRRAWATCEVALERWSFDCTSGGHEALVQHMRSDGPSRCRCRGSLRGIGLLRRYGRRCRQHVHGARRRRLVVFDRLGRQRPLAGRQHGRRGRRDVGARGADRAGDRLSGAGARRQRARRTSADALRARRRREPRAAGRASSSRRATWSTRRTGSARASRGRRRTARTSSSCGSTSPTRSTISSSTRRTRRGRCRRRCGTPSARTRRRKR